MPYAVDIDRFNITEKTITFDCLVYYKHRKTDVLNKVLDELKAKNMSFKVISYGSYTEETYLQYLKECKFMLSVDAHESQGFALQEAMSCNTPLLVLDATSLYDESNDGVRSIYEHHRPKKLYASSVPYWSEQCGIRIENTDELPKAIELMLNTYTSYTPREYIINTLSPTVCMKRILDYFG
jgi:glycosyltransferase involved in cell wall biosynthesis